MAGERRIRILGMLAASTTPGLETRRLCQVCAEVTGASGAGIMLMAGDLPRGSICTTDDVSALVEHLQFELGEGPCVDACQQNRPVLEPDLAEPATPRWLAFAGPALDAGVRAIFGFPMRVGAVRLGALNLYSDRPGPLSDDQYADAMAVADVAAEAVVAMQANAEPGLLAQELEAGGDFQYVVHQASGMVAAQLDVSVGQALIRLRAYAFGNDRLLTGVAEDVVGRRLRFDHRSGEKDPDL
ncbi:MAG: GAF and ANTAR domain-containing protein [Actinobacteria bacterium]|nr:GAF and ANTAR domain-containing protein [Actinomycetota bacterium]